MLGLPQFVLEQTRVNCRSFFCHQSPMTNISLSDLDPADPEITEIVADLLERQKSGATEQNIASLIRSFLVQSRLVRSEDISEQIQIGPGQVDLLTPSHIFEFKATVGSGHSVYASQIEQLDRYLGDAKDEMPGVRYGVLTDGRTWVLRRPNERAAEPAGADVQVLADSKNWIALFEWLQEQFSVPVRSIAPTEELIRRRLGQSSRLYREALPELFELREGAIQQSSIDVKQQLWSDLLAAALGESADGIDQDRLFVRHTYLSITVALAVQAAFGLDIVDLSRRAPKDLLDGNQFYRDTGIHGAINSGFFAWPTEILGFEKWLEKLARAVAQFNWHAVQFDFARLLYESIITADERRGLGEYYTPQWLADAVVVETVTSPLKQSVLDPACGSGTFLFAAIRRYISAAKEAEIQLAHQHDWIQNNIVGIDVHPVSVQLARSTWLLAAREVLMQQEAEVKTSVPVYLGDSLQLRTPYRQDDLDRNTVTVPIPETADSNARKLRFPVALVDQGDWFDEIILRLAQEVEAGRDPVPVITREHRLPMKLN